MWAGEVTNDAFAPLRAPRLTLARAQRDQLRAGRALLGPPPARGAPARAVQGRWSLTASLLRGEADPGTRRRALGELLLERQGILTREGVLAEGVAGGFSAIYSELTQLETLGVARRGYFVEGLGGAQFALPGRGRAAARAERSRRSAARAQRGRPRAAVRRGAAVAGAPDGAAGDRPAPPGRTSC